MRIAVCDDEEQYRLLLHDRILSDSILKDYEAEIFQYGGGRELIQAVEQGAVFDVIFLDIQMEQGRDEGIAAAKRLREMGVKSLIVYVTGFIDYMQTGYEVRAFRYLLKSQIGSQLSAVLSDIRRELFCEDSFSFQFNHETILLPKRDILCFQSDRRQVRILTQEKEYAFYDSLDHVEERLRKEQGGMEFLRCHRSYLVNISQICRYNSEEILLKNGLGIPISRSFTREVRRILMLRFAMKDG